MAYAIFGADPGDVPANFDKLKGENDGPDGLGANVWVVVHVDDPTLVAWYSGLGLSPQAHGEGTWSPGDLTRTMSGLDLVGVREDIANLRLANMSVAINVRTGLDNLLDSIEAGLPPEPA